jgi:hypothetical protein
VPGAIAEASPEGLGEGAAAGGGINRGGTSRVGADWLSAGASAGN